MNISQDIISRFWAKVHKTDGCWLWTASKRHKGYGAFAYTLDGKMIHDRSHRFSYRLHVGEIPPGLFVLHRCDTPACVNPVHLFLGTNQDNVRDMHAKGRAVKPGSNPNKPPRWAKGERHHAAKFTVQDIQNIRTRYAAGGVSYSQLAREYNTGTSAIAKVVLRLRWRHV
jgi:hypothetical protein